MYTREQVEEMLRKIGVEPKDEYFATESKQVGDVYRVDGVSIFKDGSIVRLIQIEDDGLSRYLDLKTGQKAYTWDVDVEDSSLTQLHYDKYYRVVKPWTMFNIGDIVVKVVYGYKRLSDGSSAKLQEEEIELC